MDLPRLGATDTSRLSVLQPGRDCAYLPAIYSGN